MARVALIEDDIQIGNVLRIALGAKGVEVSCFRSGEEFFRTSKVADFELFLVDLNLGRMSGLQLCERIRLEEPSKPIIVITADGTEEAAVSSLSQGADDFVRKPFGMNELHARILKHLGRKAAGGRLTRFEGLELNHETQVLLFEGVEIELSRKEFGVLALLLQRAGGPVPREAILGSVDGEQTMNDRTLDTHVSNLRKKLARAGAAHVRIMAVYGLGYRLDRDPGAQEST
jgi:DNA-binding response OmpR family regulator